MHACGLWLELDIFRESGEQLVATAKAQTGDGPDASQENRCFFRLVSGVAVARLDKRAGRNKWLGSGKLVPPHTVHCCRGAANLQRNKEMISASTFRTQPSTIHTDIFHNTHL
jgi:hypothetical protein